MLTKSLHSFLFLNFHIILLVLVDSSEVVFSGSVVEFLPGFPGPLPFHLETGYISVDDKEAQKENAIELFYYFVKSERDPKHDPIMLWLTGGPGCSSLSALAYTNGPLYFDVKAYINGSLPTLMLNPNSWTKVSSIIYIDAPVGTGFSFSRTAEGSNTGDLKSAGNTHQFLEKWLIGHPEFFSNPLYIGGDSMAGKVVPILSQRVINDIEAGEKPFFNFKGYLIGNGVVDRQLEVDAEVPFAHGMGLIPEDLYELMMENCKGENYIKFDVKNANCSKYWEEFKNSIADISIEHILEPDCALDFRKQNEETQYRRSLVNNQETLLSKAAPFPGCRNYNYLMAYYWANDDRVREALHVKKGTVGEWVRCLDLPYAHLETVLEYHRNLSTKGYRSLVYSGDHDMGVSHISTQAWIRALGLSITDDWRPWLFNGQVAGYTRTYSSALTFATVKGGGHVAPDYKPGECFAMFDRWLSYNPL